MHNNKHCAPAHTMNSKRTGQTLALAALLLGVFLNTQPAAAATASRTSGFVYDPASGLLIKEIIEPGDPNLCLVTEYAYDTYGNKTSVTTRNCNGTAGEAAAPAAGSDAVIAPRTTTSTYTYNADGSLTNVTSNALGHSESKTFEPKFGNVVSLTGPNNLTTSWTYDNWGRKTLETRADGTTTAWSYVWGNGGVTSTQSPVKYYITTTVSGQANPVYDYYDSLSRKVLSAHRNFANTDWIDTGNVVFDNAGRVIKSYLTYERAAFAGTKFSTVTYDAIGRAVSQTVPDSAAASGYSTASTTFNGLTTVVTNALGQTKTTVKNLAGQTASIADAQGNLLSYTYDAFGNLLTTTDPAGNVIVKIAAIVVVSYFVPVMAASLYSSMCTAASAAALAAGTTLTTAGVNAMFIASSALAGAAGGFMTGLISSGGDINAAMNGAATGALGGALFTAASFAGGIGEVGANTFERYAAHAAAGCVSAVAGGGKCGSGAASAVVGKGVTNLMNFMDEKWDDMTKFTVTTVSGGVTSMLGGDKFANGARTAAMGYLFNKCASEKFGCSFMKKGSVNPRNERPEMEHSGETNSPPQLSQETKDAIKLGAKIVGYAGEGVAAHALAEGEVRVAAVALTVSTAASVVEGLASEEPGKTGITIAASMAAERVARIFGMSRIGAMTTGMFVGRHADYELNGPP